MFKSWSCPAREVSCSGDGGVDLRLLLVGMGAYLVTEVACSLGTCTSFCSVEVHAGTSGLFGVSLGQLALVRPWAVLVAVSAVLLEGGFHSLESGCSVNVFLTFHL